MSRIPVVRVQLVRERSIEAAPAYAHDPQSVERIVRAAIGTPDREHLVVLALNAKHRVVSVHVASIGGSTGTYMDIPCVLRFALLASATAIVVSHNHPSGDPMPSNEDVEATHRLAAACKTVGLSLVDHVIVGDDDHVSLFESGVFKP